MPQLVRSIYYLPTLEEQDFDYSVTARSVGRINHTPRILHRTLSSAKLASVKAASRSRSHQSLCLLRPVDKAPPVLA